MSTLVERGSGVEIDDDDRLYEVIGDVRVEKSVGASEVLMANRLAFAINSRAVPDRSGFAIVEVMLDIGHPEGDQFRPDVAYVLEERWPRGRPLPPGNAWAVVPDLAVEIVRPSNSADEIRGKVEIYLNAGVRLVWVVYPRLRRVDVHGPSSTIRSVGPADVLDGGEVLPAFRLNLADLFDAGGGPT